MCNRLSCKTGTTCTSLGPAAEGTNCDTGKVCQLGFCKESTSNSNDGSMNNAINLNKTFFLISILQLYIIF